MGCDGAYSWPTFDCSHCGDGVEGHNWECPIAIASRAEKDRELEEWTKTLMRVRRFIANLCLAGFEDREEAEVLVEERFPEIHNWPSGQYEECYWRLHQSWNIFRSEDSSRNLLRSLLEPK